MPLFFLIFSSTSFSLTVDRNLRLRILSHSNTKRTVLLNKGEEDGLKVGDHAKFFIHKENVFARGIVRKISPSRSLWSVYRIVTKTLITKNGVINLTITKSVKLTDDSSKSILGEKLSKSGINERIKVRQIDKKGNYKSFRNLPFIPRGVNFSSISESFKEKKDPNVNFSSLNEKYQASSGKRPQFQFRPTIDYTALDEKILRSNHYEKVNKNRIKEEGFERLNEGTYQLPEKVVEKKFPNLLDFIY